MNYRGRGNRDGGEDEDEDEEAGETANTHSTSNEEEEEEVGGFGGGPGQMPHCATTYAAVLSLVIIAGLSDSYPQASRMALDLLKRKRKPLYVWFLTLRRLYHPPNNGTTTTTTTTTTSPSSSSSSSSSTEATIPCGYRMHHDGEVDVSASYTLCSVASLLNILTPDLIHGAIEYIVQCQTFEGGFGGCPFAEAHGGYTFCALAALHILAGATTATATATATTKSKKVASLEECCVGLEEDALRGWLSR